MSISSDRLGVASGTLFPHRVKDEAEPGEKDRQAEHHAHGEPAAIEVADLRVRQAHELHRDAREGVADAENSGDEPGPAQREADMRGEADDEEEDEAFEQRLVELARMARQVLG